MQESDARSSRAPVHHRTSQESVITLKGPSSDINLSPFRVPQPDVKEPGKHYLNQLNHILGVLGSPTPSDLLNDNAKSYLALLPYKPEIPFSKIYPMADPQAMDLLEQTLTYNPGTRITVTEALQHPYLEQYYNTCQGPDF